jgi:ribosomal protein L11 methyltransferase
LAPASIRPRSFACNNLPASGAQATEQSFLDIGCGSGILAIAAAKLGYSPVVAFDNDPEAVRASRDNIKRNKVRVVLRCADLTRLPLVPRRRYDLICANLICDLLVKRGGENPKFAQTGRETGGSRNPASGIP